MKKDIIIMVIVGLFIAIILFFLYKNEKISSDYDLKIYFFNAGKADAILISKNEKYIMIDTGEESLSKEILNYFENNNIKRLEYLIITHFDKDHVGSASSIIDNIEIGEVLQSNSPKDSTYYQNYLNSLEKKNITPTTVSGDTKISFEKLKINVNGPETIYEKNESNNSSLIVSIIYNNNSFLFMGDSENARIKDFLKENNATYDFIKIPYHGNYLKRLDNLLEEINPKYGVITCSNSEGCEEETMNVIKSFQMKPYLTKNGSISVYSNGDNILIKQ